MQRINSIIAAFFLAAATLMPGMPALSQTADPTHWHVTSKTDAMDDSGTHSADVWAAYPQLNTKLIFVCWTNARYAAMRISSNLGSPKDIDIGGMIRIDKLPAEEFLGRTMFSERNLSGSITEISLPFWAANQLIQKMKRGNRTVIRLYTDKGENHDMTFSLIGFTRAINQLAAKCPHVAEIQPDYQGYASAPSQSPGTIGGATPSQPAEAPWGYGETNPDAITGQTMKHATVVQGEKIISFYCVPDNQIIMITSSGITTGQTGEYSSIWYMRIDSNHPAIEVQGTRRKKAMNAIEAHTAGIIPAELVPQMKEGNTVLIRTYSSDGNPQDTRLPLTGFSQAYSQLEANCK